ncbi:Hpt domain-containing protein [Dongshaea marina]|uniref:Hpt domain-containing protein n=1 Tax=Dongshaea marina TaxID=2047966 RepID=UPI000D3EB6C6|nr:Hpt domain-containing protein [Dongshaea marina]
MSPRKSEPEEVVEVFAEETEQMLCEMEAALLALEDSPQDSEQLNRAFRTMHTIKGAAGLFGFDPIVNFAHQLEGELSSLRDGEHLADPKLIALLLRCKDHASQLAAEILNHGEVSEPLLQEGQQLLVQLFGDEVSHSILKQPVEAERPEASGSGSQYWLILLQFKRDSLRNGLDPLSFIRYLSTLGSLVDVITLFPDSLLGSQMDAEGCYLGFCITFKSEVTKARIQEVFEFVEDDCDIQILPPSQQQLFQALLEELPYVHQLHLREVLNRLFPQPLTQPEGSATPLQQAVPLNPIQTPCVRRVISQTSQDDPPVRYALSPEPSEKKRAINTQDLSYIRIDAHKLSELIDQVGELVISGAAIKLLLTHYQIPDVDDVLGRIESQLEEIRDSALRLRMVQIEDTFIRFRRVVRDLSRELGKEVVLTIQGGRVSWIRAWLKKSMIP